MFGTTTTTGGEEQAPSDDILFTDADMVLGVELVLVV
jgi:hypothetical protein